MKEKVLFDDNWRFHEGNINTEYPKDKGPVYVQSKTERKVWGPAAIHYTAVPNDFDTKNCLHGKVGESNPAARLCCTS